MIFTRGRPPVFIYFDEGCRAFVGPDPRGISIPALVEDFKIGNIFSLFSFGLMPLCQFLCELNCGFLYSFGIAWGHIFAYLLRCTSWLRCHAHVLVRVVHDLWGMGLHVYALVYDHGSQVLLLFSQ